jgi:hypothetical protein
MISAQEALERAKALAVSARRVRSGETMLKTASPPYSAKLPPSAG